MLDFAGPFEVFSRTRLEPGVESRQSDDAAPFRVNGMTRRQADGRIGGVPEVMAALYAGPIGQVQGPLRGLNGWYFVQVESRAAANMDSLETVKGQLTGEILQRRQQAFMAGLTTEVRQGVKVQDLRYAR